MALVREQRQIASQEKMALNLAIRAKRNLDKSGELCLRAPTALGQVRLNGRSGTLNLARQTE